MKKYVQKKAINFAEGCVCVQSKGNVTGHGPQCQQGQLSLAYQNYQTKLLREDAALHLWAFRNA